MIREASIVQVMSAAAVKSMKSHRHVDASAEAITASRRAKRAAGKFLESSMHVSKRTPVNMLTVREVKASKFPSSSNVFTIPLVLNRAM